MQTESVQLQACQLNTECPVLMRGGASTGTMGGAWQSRSSLLVDCCCSLPVPSHSCFLCRTGKGLRLLISLRAPHNLTQKSKAHTHKAKWANRCAFLFGETQRSPSPHHVKQTLRQHGGRLLRYVTCFAKRPASINNDANMHVACVVDAMLVIWCIKRLSSVLENTPMSSAIGHLV